MSYGFEYPKNYVDDYMKVEHNVWEKQLAGWGYNPIPWMIY
jgi:hypothetical protein